MIWKLKYFSWYFMNLVFIVYLKYKGCPKRKIENLLIQHIYYCINEMPSPTKSGVKLILQSVSLDSSKMIFQLVVYDLIQHQLWGIKILCHVMIFVPSVILNWRFNARNIVKRRQLVLNLLIQDHRQSKHHDMAVNLDFLKLVVHDIVGKKFGYWKMLFCWIPKEIDWRRINFIHSYTGEEKWINLSSDYMEK